MLGFDFNSAISNFALTWLPVMFFLLMVVVVYLLWKTVKLMPRVKPMEIAPGTASFPPACMKSTCVSTSQSTRPATSGG